MSKEHGSTRREILGGAIGLLGLATSGLAPRAQAQQTAAPAAPGPAGQAAGGAQPPRALPGTQVVLLGTRAGPGVDLHRAQTATVILVDGMPYLVDCGYGTVRNLVAAGVEWGRIEKIVFTHLHNDHTTDLPALLSLQWTAGRTKPIDLYGPYGTEQLVRAVNEYCKADVGIRSVDEGRQTRPEMLYHGHDVEAAARPFTIFKDDRLTVSGIENSHYPEHSRSQMPHRSIGVRFDTPHRSVVISGDTTYSANLVQLAKNADVFICEVMDPAMRQRWLDEVKRDPGAASRASVNRHVAETHSTPEEVGRMAAEAGVKLVVLNHQLTSAGTSAPLAPLIEGVRKAYSGEVILGQDLMMI